MAAGASTEATRSLSSVMPASSSSSPRFASTAWSESRWSQAAPVITPLGDAQPVERPRALGRVHVAGHAGMPRIAWRAISVSRRASRMASSTVLRTGAPSTAAAQNPSSSRTNASP